MEQRAEKKIYMEKLGKRAVSAKETVAFLNVIQRQEGLILAADALAAQQAYIIEENQKDIMLARKNKMTEPLIDRLLLNENRIRKMAEGLREIAALPDILGEIISMKTRPNGLQIGEKRVPLGVVGIIYEARPNVTADAFGICFKTGNVAVLKGGSAAANSCRAIAEVIRGALAKKGMEPDALILVEDTSRESALEMMRMKDYLDVLIPRGGASLIASVVENSTVPVIETGTGNCHIYVDEFADVQMAAEIIENAKTQRLGVCIILLTIVIYTLLMPLTIKQQKFSKMSAAMNPELQKVQQKYKGKNDQASMQKMQEETQLVYEKYGVSPTGGCLSMFIQFPILWAMYYVIRNIPAYVGQVKAVYTPLLTSIMAQDGWQKVMEKIGEAKPILMSASKYDYSDKNVLIDVLYKFQTSTWETLGKKLPDLQSTIDSTVDTLKSMNNFLGLNIAETPMNLISNGVKAGAWGIVIMAVLIPVLSGLSQYLSVKLSQQTTAVTNNPQADQMASTMKTMNVTLPLVSVFMCFTLPTGLGIYWVASAVVRMVQQFFINKHLNKIPMDELIKENMEKAAEKRKNKNEVDASNVNKMAHKNVKNIHEPVRTAAQTKELEEKLEEAKKKNENAKAGSLADKANLVKRFNEGQK